MNETIVQILDYVFQVGLSILQVLLFAHRKPSEMQIPVERAPMKIEAFRIGECLFVDDVDNRTDDRMRILFDSS